jgi:hypothetical protein
MVSAVISGGNRFRWFVGLDRTAAVLAFVGFIGIAVGALCLLPTGLVNPKQVTSLFAVLAASGSLVPESRLLLEIGCLLVALALAIKIAIRAKFRAPLSRRRE